MDNTRGSDCHECPGSWSTGNSIRTYGSCKLCDITCSNMTELIEWRRPLVNFKFRIETFATNVVKCVQVAWCNVGSTYLRQASRGEKSERQGMSRRFDNFVEFATRSFKIDVSRQLNFESEWEGSLKIATMSPNVDVLIKGPSHPHTKC